MTTYQEFKQGNRFRYNGPINKFCGFQGTITEKREDGAYNVTIDKRFPNDTTHNIVAYTAGMAPIFMDVERLQSLGFSYNTEFSCFNRKDVNIINVAYRKPTEDFANKDSWMLDIKGFRLIVEDINIEYNEDEVMAKTIDVNCLHALQNYYMQIKNETIIA